MLYRQDREDRLALDNGDRVILVPTNPFERGVFSKIYFYDVEDAKEFAKKYGLVIENIDDFDFKAEKALYLFNKGVEGFKEAHHGQLPHKILMSKAAREALEGYIDFRGESALGFDVEIFVEEAYNPNQIWVDCSDHTKGVF